MTPPSLPCYGWNARDIRGSKVTEGSIDPLGATQYKGAPLVGYGEDEIFFSTGDKGHESISIGNNPTGTITSHINTGFLTEKAIAMTTGDFTGIGDDVCPTLMRRDYKDPNVVIYPEKSSVCVDDFTQNCIDAGIPIVDGNEYEEALAMSTGHFISIGYGVCPTLLRRDDRGPNIVAFPEKALAIRMANTKANGNGFSEDVAHTLACSQPEVVAYKMDAERSNSMKSSNPNSGFHEEKVCCTLDTSTQNPVKNQGGMMIVEPTTFAFEGNGCRPSHRGSGLSEEDGPMFTLNTTEVHGVMYPSESSPDERVVLMDQGGQIMTVEHDRVGTIRAEMGGHPPVVLEASSEMEASDATP